MNKVLLLDGFSLIFRAYYGSAYSGNILKNKDSVPINGVLTFHKMLFKYINLHNPDYIFIALDAGKKTFRHELKEDYKAGRQKAPEELVVQIPIIIEMIKELGIGNQMIEGWEADDIIASFVNKKSIDNEIIVVSSDKDLHQVIRDNVKISAPKNGNNPDEIYDNDNYFSKVGILPNQVIDYKGLVGDSSDNLPGVKGVGQKTGIKLINDYNNLENLYDNIDKIESNSLKNKLNEDKEQAFLCKKLATLNFDLDIVDNFKKFDINTHPQSAIDFYYKYHLYSLIEKYS